MFFGSARSGADGYQGDRSGISNRRECGSTANILRGLWRAPVYTIAVSRRHSLMLSKLFAPLRCSQMSRSVIFKTYLHVVQKFMGEHKLAPMFASSTLRPFGCDFVLH